MKTFREFHNLWGQALDAIERKATSEQHAKEAQQALARAQTERDRVEADTRRTKAEADAHVRARKAEQDKVDAELKAVRVRETAQHMAWIENAKGQVDAASKTLTDLQAEIAAARIVRDAVNAEVGKLRAAFADSAAKL